MVHRYNNQSEFKYLVCPKLWHKFRTLFLFPSKYFFSWLIKKTISRYLLYITSLYTFIVAEAVCLRGVSFDVIYVTLTCVTFNNNSMVWLRKNDGFCALSVNFFLFLIFSWRKWEETIIWTFYRGNAKYFTWLISPAYKTFRQPFVINNYPVVQTNVVIVGDVKYQMSRHVHPTATQTDQRKMSHSVACLAQTCVSNR